MQHSSPVLLKLQTKLKANIERSNGLTSASKQHLKYNQTLYPYMCWDAFNKVISQLQEYMQTNMYSGKEHLTEHETCVAIHNELQMYKNIFKTLCSNHHVPLFEIKKTDAYKHILSLTQAYAHHTNLTGHQHNDPRIYYQNSKPNMDTLYNTNQFSYFKRKLNQLETCGLRKIKQTPYDFSVIKK